MNSFDQFDPEMLEVPGDKFYIRYMLTIRCKKIVKEVLGRMDINYVLSEHGALCFPDTITGMQETMLRRNLKEHGLELLSEGKSNLVDRIIKEITIMIHSSKELPRLTFSEVLNIKLDSKEKSTFNIFSDVMGMSVIQFIVASKVDRIKELLLYEDLPLSEISDMLYYKNEKELIAQFKKNTGLSPKYFLKLKEKRNKIASEHSSVKQ